MSKIIEFVKRNITNILLSIVIFLLIINAFSGSFSRLSMAPLAFQSGRAMIAGDAVGSMEKTTTVSISILSGYGKLDESRNVVISATKQVGGKIISENTYKYEKQRSVYMTAKIPHNRSGEFESMIEKAGEITYLSKSVADVSEEYHSVEQELESLRQFRERLLQLSKNATLDELITIENKLRQIEVEIRDKERELDRYKSRMAYDTYHISISEKEPPTAVFSSPEDIQRNFLSSMNAGLNFITAVVGFAIPFLPIAAIFLVRKIAKRIRKGKS